MPDNRNFLIAIVLSIAVLIGWQYFIAAPHLEKQQQQLQQQQAAETKAPTPSPAADGSVPSAASGPAPATPAGGVTAPSVLTREAALATSPRVPLATAALSGSINLRGGRLDDVRLNDFHETVDPKSPTIVLLSPTNGPDGYFAEFGWIGASSGTAPGPDTLWSAPEGAKLSETTPVTLTYDNGAGLVFTRKIEIDEHYMFTVTDNVANTSGAPATVDPLRSSDQTRRAAHGRIHNPP